MKPSKAVLAWNARVLPDEHQYVRDRQAKANMEWSL